jgi:hypothetical protein
MFEVIAIVVGFVAGVLAVLFLKKKADPAAPVEYRVDKTELRAIDDEIPVTSGSSRLDDLVSWADRERERARNENDNGG